ncbi:MAG TPA: GNAT family N-acetyltransferase [Polyangiaceae bacterium]|nr:GNAT family N-acetyltransferase [Polyangiaceae bacterium]
MPEAYLASLQPSEKTAKWSASVTNGNVTVLVAVQTDAVVGFCSLVQSRDHDAAPRTGELATLYVHPDHWRSGIGASLLNAATDDARRLAFDTLTLWVLAGNSPARAFYEALGFVVDGNSKTDKSFGFPINEVRYRRPLD